MVSLKFIEIMASPKGRYPTRLLKATQSIFSGKILVWEKKIRVIRLLWDILLGDKFLGDKV
jgi:hypothetical protein